MFMLQFYCVVATPPNQSVFVQHQVQRSFPRPEAPMRITAMPIQLFTGFTCGSRACFPLVSATASLQHVNNIHNLVIHLLVAVVEYGYPCLARLVYSTLSYLLELASLGIWFSMLGQAYLLASCNLCCLHNLHHPSCTAVAIFLLTNMLSFIN